MKNTACKNNNASNYFTHTKVKSNNPTIPGSSRRVEFAEQQLPVHFELGMGGPPNEHGHDQGHTDVHGPRLRVPVQHRQRVPPRT